VGPVVHRFASVVSTQAEARRLFEGGCANVGHVVVADVQQAGRGRFGRGWISPAGNLHATFIVLFDLLHAVRAAVCVVQAMASYGIRARLKWPNDVMVRGKKIAGILIERVDDVALIGIGVNLEAAPLDSSTSARALGHSIGRDHLLETLWATMTEERSPAEALAAYRAVSDTIGRTVRVSLGRGARAIEGVAIDVDERGQLLVGAADGTHTVSSGDSQHLREVSSTRGQSTVG
jgi:BirA family biotin operon repressor/biotin-[acetyl-CoA-carboxylase] ligase